MIRALLLLVALELVALAGPAAAVQPDEVLADPALEARARAISQGLRCLVCRNETIDDSDAGLARDLRLLVRERLMAGDSDQAVVAAVVARYGDYVLLRPPARGANLILWVAGPVLLVLGAIAAAGALRRRPPPEPPLTPEEEARLAALLDPEGAPGAPRS